MIRSSKIEEIIQNLSSPLDLTKGEIAIILAAGHGRRIKSETPKMLHKIWGVPTIVRVSEAITRAFKEINQIIVIGEKGEEVAQEIGKRLRVTFVYQKEQVGTGDALRVALESLNRFSEYKGNIYVFPGDMGLITPEIIREFKEYFEKTSYSLLLLTGQYQGEAQNNYYGRIIRASKDGKGEVLEILEYKDILSLDNFYEIEYNGKKITFHKEELLNTREFNAGVYAFRAPELRKYIGELKRDNVQKEFYLTSLVSIFRRHGLSLGAYCVKEPQLIIGFNTKSVWRDMEEIARSRVYDTLKNIITIEDRSDFFIADEVVKEILDMEKEQGKLDITLEKGVQLHRGVKLSRGVQIGRDSILKGNIILGEFVVIREGVKLSTYPNQTLRIGARTEIFQGDVIKGNTIIGANCSIESSVNITGSDDYPTRIGDNVVIKGTSYIFGSIIENDLLIQHSVLIKKYVEKIVKRNGEIQPIKFYLPQPEGIDSIREIGR
jgi:bifunctional UDP-N-acetylglucosamine pyrophosphorylase/glucosamine-1-phosphate N-acetyltransferase